jgi:hypothetical protein
MWVFCIMEEVYKDVIGYEGIYQISNFGNVKSCKNNLIRNPYLEKSGYYSLRLYINSIGKTRKVHQLVAESFLNHKRCGYKLVINHIDFNKSNNKVDNLEIITNRENCNKKHLKSTSKYVGVHWNKEKRKWKSTIRINGNRNHLGYFNNELEASEAYQQALLNFC